MPTLAEKDNSAVLDENCNRNFGMTWWGYQTLSPEKAGPYLLTVPCLPHLTIDPRFPGAEAQIIGNPIGLEARLASNL